MATTKKKSHAQIERMKKRAAARGDVYQAPPTTSKVSEEKGEKTSVVELPSSTVSKTKVSNGDTAKATVARKLAEELKSIESNADLKAKDRRSAKRKAEAIAAEHAGCSATELLEWLKQQQEDGHQEQAKNIEESGKSKKDDGKKSDHKDSDDTSFHQHNSRNPYVVFVGQLSYTTTKEQLLEHIRSMLGDEHDISEKTVRIRLLTDAKTNKSRGMAFVQVSNPEVLYACLKLHKTLLDGRRINVERTTGGKQHSEARQAKLKSFREEQDNYMSELVDKLLREYREKGELVDNELDEGVIKLLKRHSGQVAHKALEQYVESKGRDMDNPSAYLSFLVGKVAEEMLEELQQQQLKKKKKKPDGKSSEANRKRKLAEGEATEGESNDNRKRKLDGQTLDHESKSGSSKPPATHKKSQLTKSSEMAKAGVDMSLSEGSNENPLSKIFPSMSRGRGRGRS